MKFFSSMNRKRIFAMVMSVGMSIIVLFGGINQMRQARTQYITIQTSAYTQQTVKAKEMKVKATAYANDPITYTGTVPKPGHTIAVDPRVIPLGTKVYIPEFDKVFVAEDTGGKIKGNRIDIYMNTEDECIQWGIKEITIYVIQE